MIQRLFCRQQIPKAALLILLIFSTVYSIHAQDRPEFSFQEISKDSTFDVVTWNIEWFGDSERGPDNDQLQLQNVIEVIRTIDADLYAFQEIVNKPLFFALRDSLEGFSGFFASYVQQQKTAYLFRTSVIDSLDSGLLEAQQDEDDWAGGRFPLFFEFDLSIGEKTLRTFTYNLHSKAFADQNAYNQRSNSAASLKNYLDRSRSNASVLVLGDFNDGLTESTYQNEPSPYSPFVEDDFYLPITLPLEEDGQASYLSEQFRSFIDHIIATNTLKKIHIQGAQQVADISYIQNFESTTSDHAPVWTRFDFTENFEDTFVELPDEFAVGPNYPNPFNPATTIPFELNSPTTVSLSVYDMMGRTISVVTDQEPYNAGEHTLTFDASGLSSGIYIYRLELGTGESRTQKMSYIK
ncbi:MAG: T9SS type A sorting domain-containing protein [Balneolaceae bacterium]|nr:T9SS type A sorting domain-containing protein [Balneolaceae bacterium]